MTSTNLSSDLKPLTESNKPNQERGEISSTPPQKEFVRQLVTQLLTEQPLSAEGFVSDRGSDTLAILRAQDPSLRSALLQEQFYKAIEELMALGLIQSAFSTVERAAPNLRHVPIERIVDIFRRSAIVANAENGTKIAAALNQLQDYSVKFAATALVLGFAHTVVPAMFLNAIGVKILLLYGAGMASEAAADFSAKIIVPSIPS